MDIMNFYRGGEFEIYKYLGAHLSSSGTVFRTYAPNAEKVSVIGDFSSWEELPMNKTEDGRFYELIVEEAKEGMRYKYRVYEKKGGFTDHCDPPEFDRKKESNRKK